MKERSIVFWVGLILFCLALVELFGIAWMTSMIIGPLTREHWVRYVKGLVPLIVAGIVFLVIGIAMMKSEYRGL